MASSKVRERYARGVLCLVRREWAATENELEASFSGLLEVPCQATHDETRIARHKMDVIDAAGLIAQS